MSDIKQHDIGCQSTESLDARACVCGLHDKSVTQQADTPETDKAYANALWNHECGGDGFEWFYRCDSMLECARKLEHERDEAKAALLGAGFQHNPGAGCPWKPPVNKQMAEMWQRLLDVERERDEARKMQRDRTDERDAALRDRYLWEQERDQLRKVADELALWLKKTNPDAHILPRMGYDHDVTMALESYNQLPHVIARKESLT